jgi:hypothetical protein
LKLPGAVVCVSRLLLLHSFDLVRLYSHSLVTNPLSRLVATFTALPSPLPQLSSSGTFKHTSSRPVSHYGSAEPWPLWSPPSSPPLAEQALYAFFAHSSAGLDLKIRQRDNGWTGCESDFSAYVLGRTWVTLANDFPIYKLDGFKNAQDELRQNKVRCASSLFPNQFSSSSSNPRPRRSNVLSHAGTVTPADAPLQRTVISRTFSSKTTLRRASRRRRGAMALSSRLAWAEFLRKTTSSSLLTRR